VLEFAEGHLVASLTSLASALPGSYFSDGKLRLGQLRALCGEQRAGVRPS
jgi:hypothetical protein